eukprot:TRINITY_DN3587_c0_g1_i1.p2 TRINITY_DN3587_c0_g1~~TRINITY_DN3587_c0_g1_i1.p2  ORF type:complete len:152 (+),score=36.23 TRINITY_DN3587_c0_g1_i1:129-584(+)
MIPIQPTLKVPVHAVPLKTADRRKLIEEMEKLIEQEKQKIREWKYDPDEVRKTVAGGGQMWQQEQSEPAPPVQPQAQQQSPQVSSQTVYQAEGVAARAPRGQPQVVLEQVSEEVDVEMEDDDYDEDEEDDEDDDHPSSGEDPQNLQTDIFY